MDAPWKKAVSRQISDALVTQLPSSSRKPMPPAPEKEWKNNIISVDVGDVMKFQHVAVKMQRTEEGDKLIGNLSICWFEQKTRTAKSEWMYRRFQNRRTVRAEFAQFIIKSLDFCLDNWTTIHRELPLLCFVYKFFRNVYFFFMGSDPNVVNLAST